MVLRSLFGDVSRISLALALLVVIPGVAAVGAGHVRVISADSDTAPRMWLGASGADVSCSGSTPNVQCTVDPPGTFTLSIYADSGGVDVAGGYTEVVLQGGLTYTSKGCEAEVNLQPEAFCPAPASSVVDDGLVVDHLVLTLLLPPRPPAAQPLGAIVSMPNVTCDGTGERQVTLTVQSIARPVGSVLSSSPDGVDDVVIKSIGSKALDLNDNGASDPEPIEIGDVMTINCGPVLVGGIAELPAVAASEQDRARPNEGEVIPFVAIAAPAVVAAILVLGLIRYGRARVSFARRDR